MKLTKENATLYRCDGEDSINRHSMSKVETVAEASGIMFDCPVVGHGHSIMVYFAAHGTALVAPPGWEPLPRWQVTGKDISDITITPSINLDVVSEGCVSCGNRTNPCPTHPAAGRKTFPPGCVWHGWVTNGNALP